MSKISAFYRTALVACIVSMMSCGPSSKEEGYVPPVFEQVRTAPTTLLSEPILASVFFGIEAHKDRLIVLTYMDDCFVHWYDKTTGVKLGSALRRGKASNEILFVDSYLFDSNTGILSIYDRSTKRIAVFELTDTTATYCADATVDALPAWSNAAFAIAPNSQLLFCAEASRRSEISAHRMSLMLSDTEVSWCDQDPIPDVVLSDFVYEQPRIAFSPDRSRYAVGTFFGAILESYSIDRNNIKHQATSRFFEPKPRELLKDMSFGFADIAATNDLIYTAYNGTRDIRAFRSVAVFDWAGRPVQSIELDRTLHIARLCVDDAQRIYVVADTGDQIYRIAAIEPTDE